MFIFLLLVRNVVFDCLSTGERWGRGAACRGIFVYTVNTTDKTEGTTCLL